MTSPKSDESSRKRLTTEKLIIFGRGSVWTRSSFFATSSSCFWTLGKAEQNVSVWPRIPYSMSQAPRDAITFLRDLRARRISLRDAQRSLSAHLLPQLRDSSKFSPNWRFALREALPSETLPANRPLKLPFDGVCIRIALLHLRSHLATLSFKAVAVAAGLLAARPSA